MGCNHLVDSAPSLFASDGAPVYAAHTKLGGGELPWQLFFICWRGMLPTMHRGNWIWISLWDMSL